MTNTPTPRPRPAEILRNARAAIGLTQVALAALAEVTQPAVSGYERGTRRPSEPVAKRLGQALKLDYKLLAAPRCMCIAAPADTEAAA